MVKRLMISVVVLLLVSGFTLTTIARDKRRLPNGYILDPAGTALASQLAKFFKGYIRLVKTGDGCKMEVIRYIEVSAEDKFFQWVVRKADQNGNYNGTAEYAELQAMLDTACANRGE